MLREQLNGIQHVGIPTNDIETTIEFYGKLGFEVALQTVNEEAKEKVAFLKLNNLVIETYENKAAKMESGAIDHVAIDVKDIEKVYIAGAFGNYMDPKSAAMIGMLPVSLLEHITPVGNAAGEGAKIALLNCRERKEMDQVVRNIEFVELAASPEFQDCFVDELCFPELP